MADDLQYSPLDPRWMDQKHQAMATGMPPKSIPDWLDGIGQLAGMMMVGRGGVSRPTKNIDWRKVVSEAKNIDLPPAKKGWLRGFADDPDFQAKWWDEIATQQPDVARKMMQKRPEQFPPTTRLPGVR